MRRIFPLLLLFVVPLAHAALSLDGTTNASWSSGTTMTVTLSTTGTNEPIVVLMTAQNASVQNVTSAHLTFTKRADNASAQEAAEWTALASSALSSEVITVTYSVAPAAGVAVAFGVLGTPSSSYFDPNASLPVASTAAADPTFSTTDANTIVYGIVRFSSTPSPTPGTGWTAIYNPANGYQMMMYQVFSSAQTSTTFAVATGSGNENGAIVDAMVAATGSSCTHAGWTKGGASTVPTAGSTLVWLKSGAFGTVDCSTTSYWQPAVGNFGAN